MRHQDSGSLNLFSRLSRYVPSEGEKRVRHPLEDFCTEALAYCLVHSAGFRKKFLENIPNFPDIGDNPLLIHTQDVIQEGRVDLVLETVMGNKKIRWNGEVKIDATLRQSQRDYARFLLAPKASISRHLSVLPNGFPTITWETVQGLLCKSVAEGSLERSDSSAVFVMKQFAEFLEDKGFKSIYMKTDIYKISDPASMVLLLDEVTELLVSLRTTLNLQRRGSPPPKWEPAKHNECSFYGIYGPANQYAGIEFNPNGSVSCYYQEKFFGEKPAQTDELEFDIGESGTVWVTRRKPFPQGSQDKVPELNKIFIELQDSLRRFALEKALTPAPQDSE